MATTCKKFYILYFIMMHVKLFHKYTKARLYVSILSKLRADAQRKLLYSRLKFPLSNLSSLKLVLICLKSSGLISGISHRYDSGKFAILHIQHACTGGRPIRHAALVMRSNIKYNRTVSFKQLRRLFSWGQGADLILSTPLGIVTAETCIIHRIGGRVLGSIRG